MGLYSTIITSNSNTGAASTIIVYDGIGGIGVTENTTAFKGAANIIFAGSNLTIQSTVTNGNSYLSFIGDTNGGSAGGIAIAGGTSTNNSGTVNFANSNGISWTLSNGVMKASHNGYSATSQLSSKFLSTAAQSDHTHDYQSTGNYLTTAQQPGNYLTTAMQSNADSLFQYTSATSNITASAVNTSLLGSVQYVDSNGITWGQSVNGKSTTITASHNGWTGSAQMSSLLTNFLTTAMYSNYTSVFQYTSATSAITSNAFPSASTTKFVGTGTSATNASVTLNSNGIQISIAPGGGGADGYNILAAGGSTAASTGTIVFSNANGLSFSLNGSTITASHNAYTGTTTGWLTTAALSDHTHSDLYQSKAAYITTAMLSNAGSNFAGLGTSATNASVTLNSNGIAISIAALGDATNAVGLATAGTNITWTVNSNGISINNPAWLLTAAQSNHTHSDLYVNTSVSSNFLTTALGTNYTSHTHTYQSQGAYLTTAMLSQNTSLFRYSSDNSQLQYTSANSNLLDSAATASFQYTSNSSLLQQTSATSNITSNAFATSNSSLLLPIANSTQWNTSVLSTKFLTTAMVSNAGSNFILIGNSTEYQTSVLSNTFAHTSHTHSQYINNSISNSFQQTSATSAITASAMNTSERVAFQGSVYFSNVNGVSFGNSVDGISTTITASVNAGGVVFGNSQTTYTSGSVQFTGVNATINSSVGIGASSNSQYIGISVAAPGGGGGVAASIGGNSTSVGAGYSNITSGTMILVGGSNVTLSQDGSVISFIGATANGPASVIFTNANGISWASTTNGASTTIGASVIAESFIAYAIAF